MTTWADELVAYASQQLTERERDALYGRGVSDEQVAAFQIGYLDRRLPELAGADDFLVWCHQGAKLADMFVFPLTTVHGVVGGFQFRHVGREQKGYTDYFLLQDELCLFGLVQAMPHVWATESVFLVEGVFDLLPLQRHVPAIIPTLTAKVTPPMLRLLRRLVRRVWLGYDMDVKGRKAASEFVREHGREFDAQVVSYPKLFKVGTKELIKDPGDLWECWGDPKVRAFVLSVIE